jgi:hypothetical protein
MQMYHYRSGKVTNFGDELNVWMWPQLLPHAFDDPAGALFLGIGSTLFDFFPAQQTKIVFGAGYAGYTPKPHIDETWKIYFIRGRFTAEALNIDPSLVIGDAAILLRSCALPAPSERHSVSFMPHWESMQWGNWEPVCRRAGVHFIDPRRSVSEILSELRASELVITEAMHGAIVADALRVPWIAIEPIRPIHRMKWHDWASAIDLKLDPRRLGASNVFEWTVGTISSQRWERRFDKYGHWCRAFEEPFATLASRRLTALTRQRPSLSSNDAISTAHQRMLVKLDQLTRDLA